MVLTGVWLTGAVLTNDFMLAMALTTAWMGAAGSAARVVALRSRALRWPVLGVYVLTAAVAGAYLGSSVVFDKVVDEQVATAPAPTAGDGAGASPQINVRLGRGRTAIDSATTPSSALPGA